MEIFNQIITLLNKEEVRHFKLLSRRTETKDARKDLDLFDYTRKSAEYYDEERIFNKLYAEADKNSFYRLKNRLLSDVNKSLVMQHIEDDDNLNMFHLLSLGRFYRNRNQYKIAFYYIRKAEKKAIQIESYELLDFIYSELIQLSQEIVSINPEEYILKRKENREKLYQLRQVDDILAAVIYRLKVTQNFSATENPIFDLLKKTVDDFGDNPVVNKSPKLRFTIYQAVSRILLSRHEFATLEEYLIKTFNEFSAEGLFNRANHDTKLQMLTYLLNTLARNGKTKESLVLCEKLKEGMEEFNRLLFKKYIFYYYNGLVINYTKIKEFEKCIGILEEVIRDGHFKDQPFYECLYLNNLSVSFFNLGKFKPAMKALVQASIHEGFKLFDASLQLQLGIYELMLRMESDDFETLQKRLEKVRKDFYNELSSPAYNREAALLKLLGEMAENPEFRTDKGLQRRAREFVKNPEKAASEDYSVINYNAWVERKFGLS